MVHQSILLALLFSTSPDAVTPLDPVCFEAPSAPTRIDAQPFASTSADGTQSWGATASYMLSTGDIGEAMMVLGDDGSGEAQLMINGEIVAHVAMESPSGPEGPTLTTWYPAFVTASGDALAEMMLVDLPGVVAESLPQEFKCSGWAKKMLNAGKYLWTGAVAAGTAVCCLPPSTALCPVCLASSAVGGMYVRDKLANHCD